MNIDENYQAAPEVHSSSRRPWFLGAVLVYVVIMLVVGWGLTGFYGAARERLDEAMGERLLAVAETLAGTSDARSIFHATLGDSSDTASLVVLGQKLAELGSALDLAEITLSDPDGVVLFSTTGSLAAGQKNDYWAIDAAAIESAQAGQAAATKLYALGNSFLKSAHAPILMSAPELDYPLVVAVVTVSGSPDFFDALSSLRRGALLTGGLVFGCLLILGVFLYRIQRALDRYRASILRQENLAAMGRMTAGIAHEIRNPLGIIRGAGQHLQEDLARQGREDPIVDFIPEEVDRLDRILSRYLAFGGSSKTTTEVFAVGPMLEKIVSLLADEFAATGVKMSVAELPETRVQGDPLRLRQVVMNLLLNSRDAMPDGGTITISGYREGKKLQLVVADEGCGLPSGKPEVLFAPFHTRKEKGSGLGLTLARSIVREMGGDLVLHDREGACGAEALITLQVDTSGPAEKE